MENWDDYRVILALQRGKTLRNAAKTLGMNHSTVARRLAILNQRHGIRVFDATPQGYVLTSFGQSLYESARTIEACTLADKRSHLACDLSGSLTLSLPPAIAQFLLLDELHGFQQRHPHIQFNIRTSYSLADLQRCEADVVLRVANAPNEHLVGHRLFPVYISYYASQDYLNSKADSDYQWITDVGDERPPWLASSPYPDASIAMKLDDLLLRHYAGMHGQGLIRGACYIADQLPGLRRIQGASPKPFQDLWILTHPDLRDVPRVKVLMRFLMDALKSKQALITGNQPAL
ncbi:LysR family transcriptional regulator [Bowmanella sp. Y26]|uniref:LysR family transcriptional regulator n=1 Tax=Bowmanella yangjiangensis TaxID=2811230 RepID=UPI001BDC7698|nr:LysR family transcriptional regulator [Bowmanella yangjiangensis]MBT1062463.1 LysR family transcriptional regulator [Bowmanella yangjiangensis]